jgi:hypothetical protein
MTFRVFQTNSLFRPGADVNLNACVGINGGPYDLFDYATGYFQAAAAILASAESRAIPVDIAVYPLVFNFRHAIELSLKHFARVLPQLSGEPEAIKMTHKLADNWAVVRPLLVQTTAFDPKSTLPPFDQIVKDLIQFDPNGEVFRFPSSRDGTQHLEDVALINLKVVADTAHVAEEIVDFWNSQAQDIFQDLLEGG